MADRRPAPTEDTSEASAAEATEADERRERANTSADTDGSPSESGGSGETERGTTDHEDDGSNGERVTGEESRGGEGTDDDASGGDGDAELAALRQAVEDKYDFEEFGPEEMAEMSYEEWEAVFDADTWITGTELLDRVDADLRNRIADRDVFARIERLEPNPREREPERLLAYSDEGYALVYPDGSVDGRGTVLRDVKPTVALCSMDEYEIDDPPEGELLMRPSEVSEGSGELGNFMLQITAAMLLLAGVGLFVAWVTLDVETIVAPVAALAFVLAGLFLFFVVANARLSDRFRAEEYRDRLRAVGLESGERPDFLPIESGDGDEESDSAT